MEYRVLVDSKHNVGGNIEKMLNKMYEEGYVLDTIVPIDASNEVKYIFRKNAVLDYLGVLEEKGDENDVVFYLEDLKYIENILSDEVNEEANSESLTEALDKMSEAVSQVISVMTGKGINKLTR